VIVAAVGREQAQILACRVIVKMSKSPPSRTLVKG
jgi:hypothetical protein